MPTQERAQHLVRAAEYVRMSTEGQTCSPIVQRQAISRYAAERGIEIVRSYADEGKSGLSLSGRPALQALLEDIQSGSPGFAVLLVFDVSRWGRFQNTDEAAYYEFLCRKHGVQVTYCAEAFENDDGAYSAVVKSLKRIMAAEFSRELSNKVYLSQRQWAGRGFYCGGSPGYARRRLMVDEHGVVKGPLGPGDRKGYRTDRVVIVPGPPDEVANVGEIFRLFLDEDLTYGEIAQRLNDAGRLRADGKAWRGPNVYKILSSDTYAGANVYARRSHKLQGPSRKNPRSIWVNVPDAFPPIVDPALVARARAKREGFTRHLSDEELLQRLRDLWRREGRLTRSLMDQAENVPSGCAYNRRFGTINGALRRIGYPVATRRVTEFSATTEPLRLEAIVALRSALLEAGFVAAGGPSLVTSLGKNLKIGVTIANHEPGNDDSPDFWHVRFGRHPQLDLGIAGLLSADDTVVERWFVIPRGHFQFSRLRHIMSDGTPVSAFEVGANDLWPTAVANVRKLLGQRRPKSPRRNATV